MVPIQLAHGCGAEFASQAPVAFSFNALQTAYFVTHDDPTVAECIGRFSSPTANLSGGAGSLRDAAVGCIDQPRFNLHVSAQSLRSTAYACCQ